MKHPSVVARPLSEAKMVLADGRVGVVSIAETAPPRTRPTGPLRVVRERRTERGIELVVAPSVELEDGHGSHV